MQVYTIGYKSADGTKYIEITHERLMTGDEIEALVRDVLPDAARAQMAALAEKERKRGQVPDHLFDVCFIPRITFNHLYQHVVELLIARHGFKRLDYAAGLTVFSIPDLLVRGDAAGDPDGDDSLQERLNDTLAQAGLPVVTMDERDAQEQAKLEVLAPLRRERRAERAVARFRASGHNPFRTEDPLLVMEILKTMAGRPLDETETRILAEILPPILEAEVRPEIEDLGRAFLAYPELAELAAVLGVLPPVDAVGETQEGEAQDGDAQDGPGSVVAGVENTGKKAAEESAGDGASPDVPTDAADSAAIVEPAAMIQVADAPFAGDADRTEEAGSASAEPAGKP